MPHPFGSVQRSVLQHLADAPASPASEVFELRAVASGVVRTHFALALSYTSKAQASGAVEPLVPARKHFSDTITLNPTGRNPGGRRSISRWQTTRNDRLPHGYSLRSATMGSTRVARSAGR